MSAGEQSCVMETAFENCFAISYCNLVASLTLPGINKINLPIISFCRKIHQVQKLLLALDKESIAC